MKYIGILLLLPSLAFGIDIDTNTNTSVGYVNNSVNTSKVERPVSSAYAPYVSAGQCLHTVSAGGQVIDAGISFGFNTDSETCFALLYAAMFPDNPKMQKSIFCQTKLMKKAYKHYGESCENEPKRIKQVYPSSAGRN